MTQPLAISEVQVTFADGTIVVFDSDILEPGAHYSSCRNFNNPPRKQTIDDPKLVAETWIQHSIHFVTDREDKVSWQKRNTSDDG